MCPPDFYSAHRTFIRPTLESRSDSTRLSSFIEFPSSSASTFRTFVPATIVPFGSSPSIIPHLRSSLSCFLAPDLTTSANIQLQRILPTPSFSSVLSYRLLYFHTAITYFDRSSKCLPRTVFFPTTRALAPLASRSSLAHRTSIRLSSPRSHISIFIPSPPAMTVTAP